MREFTYEEAEQYRQKVMAVRYTEPEMQKSLCTELLEWCQTIDDPYTLAFAHTYLGSYYVSQDDSGSSISHLTEARDISHQHGYDDLLAHIYCFLGLYYGMNGEEQNSLQSYMEGILACRRAGDTVSEGLILNNIAFHFQRYHGYTQAVQYYKESRALLQGSDESRSPASGLVLSNLASVSILAGRLDEAGLYIAELADRRGDWEILDILYSQNQCQYYAAAGQASEAGYWAGCVLEIAAKTAVNKLNAFEIYAASFDSMIQVKDQHCSMQFLSLMEQYCSIHSINQQKQLQFRYMIYYRTFENEPEKLLAEYKNYFIHITELDKQNNQIITNGLKAAIGLFKVTMQKEKLRMETNSLKQQVNTDELTGVYTRRYFEQQMKQYEHAAAADSLGLIMVDVDCLKEYNDTYGHPKGDEVLQSVGQCLMTHRTAGICPCRFGGDEFVCFCTGMKDDEIECYIRAVRDELRLRDIPHRSSHCAQQVTLSIGYANEPAAFGLPPVQLLELADKALYHSKVSGRNAYSKQSL